MLIFVRRYITKRLMSVPTRNSLVSFSLECQCFPSTSPRETLRLSGKQNKLFPSGADIKCILFEGVSMITKSLMLPFLICHH
jgi:hypothetical protein